MVSPGSLSSILVVKAVFYTQSMRLTGSFRSLHARFSDAMNSNDYDHFLFHDVLLEYIRRTGAGAARTAATMAMRRHGIIVAVPNEARAGRERTASQQNLRVERQTINAVIEAFPYRITGDIHITPGSDLMAHTFRSPQLFMPVTSAEVLFEENPALNFRAPVILVNRLAVDLAMDISQIDLTDAAPRVEEELTRPIILDTHINPEQAAALLASTTVFGVADRNQLQQAMARLVHDQLIVRRQVSAGAEVFHQGDMGDTMYIVEDGALEVLLMDGRGRTHRIAEFKPGDFFGEMAVLGDRRRTATVRTVNDSQLVAVQEEAVKHLMQRFPSVARSLLAIMVQRQAANQQRNAVR